MQLMKLSDHSGVLFGNHFLLSVKFGHVFCDNIFCTKLLFYSRQQSLLQGWQPQTETQLGVGSL